MKAPGLAGLSLFVIFLASTTADQGDCPPWFFSDADKMAQDVFATVDTWRSSAAETLPC